MYGRRGFGILGILLAVVVLGAVGFFAYQAGMAAGLAGTGVVDGPRDGYVGYGGGFGFGFPFFGILLTILLVVLLVRALAGPRGWGGHGAGPGWYGPRPGGWGPGFGPGGPRDVPPAFEPMLEEWHRRAHGERPTASDTTEGGSTPGR